MLVASDMIHATFVFSISIVLITIGVRQLRKHNNIRKKGVKAKGFVHDMNGTKPVIRFVTKDDKWITAEHDMGGMYEKGETLRVIYNPASPKDFFIQNFGTKGTPYILIIAGMAAIAVGILALLHIIPWHT